VPSCRGSTIAKLPSPDLPGCRQRDAAAGAPPTIDPKSFSRPPLRLPHALSGAPVAPNRGPINRHKTDTNPRRVRVVFVSVYGPLIGGHGEPPRGTGSLRGGLRVDFKSLLGCCVDLRVGFRPRLRSCQVAGGPRARFWVDFRFCIDLPPRLRRAVLPPCQRLNGERH
jgi:hypothetical protein